MKATLPRLAVNDVPKLRRRLLGWFRRAKRDLPWRHTRDPYRIWVSEVMLQQTQVTAVVPYYLRFLCAFPDLRALATASEQQVLRLWEGLGYYRRARDLYCAAQQIVAEHAGMVPDDPERFARLPGVGRYMLGAVLSQAFERRLPILEANSSRVLCRLLGCKQDPRNAAVRNRLWEVAERLLPSRGVGDFNQALMELGALVCTPREPKCEACPLAQLCVAHADGSQDRIPLRRRKVAVTRVEEAAAVIRDGPRVLLVQRPRAGRWAGLWEFPHGEVRNGESHEQAAGRVVRRLTGLEIAMKGVLAVVRHQITRFQITITCFEARLAGGRFRSDFYPRGQWVHPRRLHLYPLSTPQRKLAASVVRSPQALDHP